MGRYLAAALLALVLVVGGAACGGDGDEVGDEAPPVETAPPNGDMDTEAAGRQIFVSSCGGCHVLSEAGTSGTVGPGLDGTALSEDEIEERVREGGGGMPAFEDVLDDDEIEAVSAYVAEQG